MKARARAPGSAGCDAPGATRKRKWKRRWKRRMRELRERPGPRAAEIEGTMSWRTMASAHRIATTLAVGSAATVEVGGGREGGAEG